MGAIKIILKVYLAGLILAGFFRFLLFYFHRDEIFTDKSLPSREIILFWFRGMLYDILTISFIVVVPFLLLVVYDYSGRWIYRRIAYLWLNIGMGLAIVIWAANVPYYNKFYQHITLKAFEWFHTPGTVIKMILQEPRYSGVIIPGIFIIYLLNKFLRKIFFKEKKFIKASKKQAWYYLLFSGLIFIGMRGKLSGHPLRIEDAYIFHNNILNELSLNPLFVLEKSIEEAAHNDLHTYKYMDDEEAFRMVRKYLHIQHPVNVNPISRYYRFDTVVPPKNVVLILMESMAAWKMRFFGNEEDRTPFLDSLFLQSIVFTNMFSAGIHTYGGIFATHFSYPLIFEHHPLRGVFNKKYYALPEVLKEKGYKTVFFLPHNKTFDNLGAFLTLNDFDTVYYDRDYPRDSIENVWGVNDRFLLHFALNKIDRLAKENNPFFATILTVSDHRPFSLPDDIKGKTDEIRATRFADRSLQEFFQAAKTKSWFKNTVFVFVADHGEPRHSIYPVPLSYTHIPAIFYFEGIQPRFIRKTAGQIDIFPVLMDMLGYDFLNMTFGMDLLKEDRKYILFNYDRLYAVADSTYLLVADRQHTVGLYRYRDGDRIDYSARLPEKRKEMEDFLHAHLQTAAYILANDLQYPAVKSNEKNLYNERN